MTLPDFVQEVLTYLTEGSGTNENWDTANYDPQPTLIDGDEWRDDSDDSRVKGVDLTQANVIVVDSQPRGTNRAIGAEYDNKFRFGAHVTIEALHSDAQGQVTDKDDFDNLVGEAKRAIRDQRNADLSSTNEYGVERIAIEQEDDGSPTGVARGNTADLAAANHFLYEFDVWFEGIEELP